MKKLSFLYLILIANIFCQMPYTFIGDQIISSYGIIKKDEPKETIQSSKTWQPEEITLSDHESREILFSILNEYQLNQNHPKLNEQVQQLVKDLEIFIGNDDPSGSLFQIIDRTTTTFGQAGLAKMLVTPSADVAALKKRQELIKLLVEDEQTFDQIEHMLYQVREKEPAIFSYWQEQDRVATKVFDKLYWGKWFPQNLNKNSYALEAKTRLTNFGTTLSVTAPLITFTILEFVKQKAAGESINFKKAAVEGSKTIWNYINPKSYVTVLNEVRSPRFEHEMRKAFRENGKFFSDSDLAMCRKGAYIGLGLSASLVTFFAGMHIYNTKNTLAHANQLKNAANHLQERLIGVATLVNTAERIKNLAHEIASMNNGLTSLDNENIFGVNDNSFQKLISLLQTSTFKNNASFFSLTGRVLAAHNLMADHKDKLAPMMELIGELDACLAIAKLYKEFQDQPVRFCFVDFVQSDKSILQLTEFWNPFVDPSCVVVNDIELGVNNRNIILTGSNTGGKSTVLKAIMPWLAQTLGIMPATKAVMTPYSYLGTSLNISDQTKKGNSLFKAEVLRAKSLLNSADALASNEFGLVIIDELFVGTASEKGAQESYKVAQMLADKENIVFILATHFPELTNLEKDTNGICKNFKMDIQKDEAGHLVRTYKLEPGISTSNVADDIFEEEINSAK